MSETTKTYTHVFYDMGSYHVADIVHPQTQQPVDYGSLKKLRIYHPYADIFQWWFAQICCDIMSKIYFCTTFKSTTEESYEFVLGAVPPQRRNSFTIDSQLFSFFVPCEGVFEEYVNYYIRFDDNYYVMVDSIKLSDAQLAKKFQNFLKYNINTHQMGFAVNLISKYGISFVEYRETDPDFYSEQIDSPEGIIYSPCSFLTCPITK
ncbi:hypothetical protein [Crocosphaera sp.]|uniref:hypothetical protein n=1 Tax=Crocosphaera sp. TaxID=2729996 RepID=UPI002627DCC7|nr:hypothetical protein [Crocosphaera sp.]MDJ0579664.1 hypothetical protein [Crocosphaera sp.]